VIVLYDDALARTFEPFATTRPLGEVRAGALLGRERWAMWFGARVDGSIVAPHLTHFAEFDAPPAFGGHCPAGCWLVNTRALPVPRDLRGAAQADGAELRVADVVRIEGRIAAVRLRDVIDAMDLHALHAGTLTLDTLAPEGATEMVVDGVWLDATWDIIRHLSTQLSQDIPQVAAAIDAALLARGSDVSLPVVLGDGHVWIEAGATIEPLTVFDVTAGPILVRRGARVHAFTRIVGPCFIGRDSTVAGDRIAASSIGDACRVHGELSMSVFIGHANKGHDGFVGHSILGRWVNLGAGTITSNLKNTYGTVAMWSTSGLRDTGMQFAGTFFGDHVKTGIGLRLTTGCVLGAGANVMDAMPPKAVAPFSWGARAPYDVFDRDKFLATAARMMARRDVTLDAAQHSHWDVVMAHALADARWPAR
jgi:UDP-N-acetylglucosamine diphosphorylase/glucosamine-1-phosphate N-acetyltransferase